MSLASAVYLTYRHPYKEKTFELKVSNWMEQINEYFVLLQANFAITLLTSEDLTKKYWTCQFLVYVIRAQLLLNFLVILRGVI